MLLFALGPAVGEADLGPKLARDNCFAQNCGSPPLAIVVFCLILGNAQGPLNICLSIHTHLSPLAKHGEAQVGF